jgi:hypothetical protein
VVASVPTSMVNAKPSSTSPPNRYNASTARNTVPDVMTVRVSVWLRLVLIIRSSGSLRLFLAFSRTRSKMTIMSFIE